MQKSSLTTLQDLRDAIVSGTVRTPDNEIAVIHLDLAEDVLGDEFARAPLAISVGAFEQRFPQEPIQDLLDAFGGVSLYQRWRTALLKYLAFSGNGDNADPMGRLVLLAKREGLAIPVRSAFEAAFPGKTPYDVERTDAIEADRHLRGQARNQLRSTLSALDWLRAVEDVQSLDLLRPEPIGQLPLYRDGEQSPVELPPRLASLVTTRPARDARNIRRLYEVAVDAELLNPNHGIEVADLGQIEFLETLHARTSEVVSRGTTEMYLRALLKLLRSAVPRLVSEDLRACDLRRPEQRPKPAQAIVKVAVKEVPSPADRCRRLGFTPLPDDFEGAIENYVAQSNAPASKRKALRSVLRRHHEAHPHKELEALLSSALENHDTIFAANTEQSRQVKRSFLKDFLRHNGKLEPWERLKEKAREADLSDQQLRGLSHLSGLCTGKIWSLSPWTCLTSAPMGQFRAI